MKKFGCVFVHLFFVVFCLGFVIPFIYVISASFTNEYELLSEGYRLIPRAFDVSAYRYIFKNPEQIINSYLVTIFFSTVGTLLGVLVMVFVGYSISRSNFVCRKFVTMFIFFTMLFSGGMVPSYILITQYLKLGNNILVYIIPSLASAWYIILFKTFFSQLPMGLIESAKIDGASELRILLQIVLPLSKPVLATVSLLVLLGKWNDWMTTLLYVRNKNLYSLQYLLQEILRETEFLNLMVKNRAIGGMINSTKIPIDSMKFAMAIVAAGPMLVIFPFFQKYFTRGLTIGSIKG